MFVVWYGFCKFLMICDFFVVEFVEINYFCVVSFFFGNCLCMNSNVVVFGYDLLNNDLLVLYCKYLFDGGLFVMGKFLGFGGCVIFIGLVYIERKCF